MFSTWGITIYVHEWLNINIVVDRSQRNPAVSKLSIASNRLDHKSVENELGMEGEKPNCFYTLIAKSCGIYSINNLCRMILALAPPGSWAYAMPNNLY